MLLTVHICATHCTITLSSRSYRCPDASEKIWILSLFADGLATCCRRSRGKASACAAERRQEPRRNAVPARTLYGGSFVSHSAFEPIRWTETSTNVPRQLSPIHKERQCLIGERSAETAGGNGRRKRPLPVQYDGFGADRRAAARAGRARQPALHDAEGRRDLRAGACSIQVVRALAGTKKDP